jgi:hypothetical protein
MPVISLYWQAFAPGNDLFDPRRALLLYSAPFSTLGSEIGPLHAFWHDTLLATPLRAAFAF